MQSTLVIAGIVLLGASILGGGLVAFNIEVPLIESRIRQMLLGALGGGLLLAGVVSGQGGATTDTTVAATTLPAPTVMSAPTTPEPTTTTTATAEPTTTTRTESAPSTELVEPEWVLLIDGAGAVGVTVPGDWSSTVTQDGIWASPELDAWVSATRGDGPALANGYAVRHLAQPDSGSFEEIAEQLLADMPVPAQCAFTRGDVERPGDGYYTYHVYECAPGGEYVNEIEIGINPPWVTLESSRYTSDADRDILSRIWLSFRTY